MFGVPRVACPFSWAAVPLVCVKTQHIGRHSEPHDRTVPHAFARIYKKTDFTRLVNGTPFDEAWSRTLVIRLAALPGGEKQNIAAELMKKQKKGLFDHLRLYVPGFVDTMCPAAGDAWRKHLAQELRAAGQHLHKKKRSLLENFLAQSVEQAVCDHNATDWIS